MFELFINTTIIMTGHLLINYCKINMITNIKQCIEMSCASVALMGTLYSHCQLAHMYALYWYKSYCNW